MLLSSSLLYNAYELNLEWSIEWWGEGMAEALKAMYNKEFLNQFALKVYAVYGVFDMEGFVATAMERILGRAWAKSSDEANSRDA